MFLDTSFPYRKSFHIHTIIGLVLGVSLAFILIFLEPFDNRSFDHPYRNALLAGYGFVIFVTYLIGHVFENIVFIKDKFWSWGREITFHVVFGISAILIAHLYHEYVINERTFSFTIFLSFLFYFALPIFPLLAMPMILLRYVLAKSSDNTDVHIKSKEPEKIVKVYIELNGENATDIVIVEQHSLLFVKSVDNYVQIYYHEEGRVQNRILRCTLSRILEQATFLLQPHRSYLINPKQGFVLNGNSQKASLSLPGLTEQIPVARSAYSKVKIQLKSNPIG